MFAVYSLHWFLQIPSCSPLHCSPAIFSISDSPTALWLVLIESVLLRRQGLWIAFQFHLYRYHKKKLQEERVYVAYYPRLWSIVERSRNRTWGAGHSHKSRKILMHHPSNDGASRFPETLAAPRLHRQLKQVLHGRGWQDILTWLTMYTNITLSPRKEKYKPWVQEVCDFLKLFINSSNCLSTHKVKWLSAHRG